MLVLRLSFICAMAFAIAPLSCVGLAAVQTPVVSAEELEERVRATLVALPVLSP